jgi:hypothetical protein
MLWDGYIFAPKLSEYWGGNISESFKLDQKTV